jgi:integrase
MADLRITKRVVDGLTPQSNEFTVWDGKMPGFGVRVRPTGAKSYVVVYRAGSGRRAPVRRYTIAGVGKIAPEKARRRAQAILGAVAHGHDPASDKASERGTPTIAELIDRFMVEHVDSKRKPGTAAFYRHVLAKIVRPELGSAKADKVTRAQIARLHAKLRETPFQANRVIAVLGSMYAFAGRIGVIPEGTNPTRKIDKFKEHRRERFLTGEELERLGSAIREAETKGIPWDVWDVDEGNPKAKHLARAENRFTKISPFAAAAIRLLLFTGCRLREILHLKWEHVDLERGLLFLADSKTGKKTVILNAPALAVLTGLDRLGSYVVPGDDSEMPRADLKRPWVAVAKRAGLDGVRLHDLRHTYASFGAGGGFGLPIIGKLLGHTQASTTQRYAHLDADPLRRASEAIGGRIAAALDGGRGGSVVQLKGGHRRR